MEAPVENSVGEARSDRRQHSRITQVELAVRFNGQTYKTANWSMGGFFLDDYQGQLGTGALVTVAGLGRCEDDIQTVNLPARVVRSGERVIAVNYLSLDSTGYDFLQRIMSESGKMRSLLDAESA